MRLGLGCLLLLFTFQAVAADPPVAPEDQRAIRELEQKVTELKTSVYESKAKLRNLEEAVLRGKITGSKAFVTFDNQAEGFFALTSAEFYIDDQLVYRIEGKGKKAPILKGNVFDSDIPAGEHTVKVKLLYQGSDRSIYTLFPYFKDHKFLLENTDKFSVEYGKTTLVKLVAMDKGYFKSDLQERLYLQVTSIRDWGTDITE